MIPPGSWLGLLGGGQLGRMFCMAAQSLGYRVAVLDPGDHSPAGTVADRHLRADYLDAGALAELAAMCRAATTEFENVPATALEYLARTCVVAPDAASVAIAQDRVREKQFLSANEFPIAPWRLLESEADCDDIDPALLPGIVKSARFGYDGKGQIAVCRGDEVRAAFTAMGSRRCVLEKRVALAGEVSVMVARSRDGTAVTWPVAENVHRNGILDVSIVPARVPEPLAGQARAVALGVAERLAYRGVLCVEMFLTTDGALLVNEIAPRPHNSGHYTIDACVTSQFEQQVRVLCDAPLGSTLQHEWAVMVNLLGDVWYPDPASTTTREPEWRVVLAHPQAKLHLYGKREARRGRKMGHVTCLGKTGAEAAAVAGDIRAALGMPAEPALG